MEEFLLWNSGEQDEARFVLFGRQSNAKHQLFLASICNHSWQQEQDPCYQFCMLCHLPKKPNLNPSSISIDFEQAAIGAIRTTFLHRVIHECFFHLTKNMRRKSSDKGLLRKCNTDHDFALVDRIIVARSFFPIDDIDMAFEALETEIRDDFTPILNWFEDVSVVRQNRKRTRSRALFHSNLWSVYEKKVNGKDRTNNYVEAAHQRRNPECSKGCDLMYEQFTRGNRPR
ncbi:hypothetical protein MXB_1521, partial [Myxobolus squamalis]